MDCLLVIYLQFLNREWDVYQFTLFVHSEVWKVYCVKDPNSSNWQNVRKILKFEDLDVLSSFKTHKNNEKNWLARFVTVESEM